MPAANSLPQFPAFGPYVDPFKAGETAFSLWTEAWRASVNATFWWTERWLQAPLAFLAWAPAPAYSPPRVGAAVIDLAQAAAARVAADIADVASAAAEVIETAAEAPVTVAEDAAAVAPVAMMALKQEATDDLTRMVGIGPKLAAALAERGVTTFAQIAAWSDQELADMDRSLELKGRAAREHWIAQAKRFAKEKD